MPAPAPRAAVAQDLSGFGRCSLTVTLPVLAAMGVQCCPLLTAYLSTHTGFPPSRHAVFLDMTDQMTSTAAHWAELGVHFDAVYSGFLGSAAQIDCLEHFLDAFHRPGTLVLVDPVMADHGRLYRSYTPKLCRRMAELAAWADCITPNLTEAAILLGEDYENRPTDEDGIRRWLERLSLNGRRSVLLTGVSLEEGKLGAACLDRADGVVHFAMAPREPGQFSGTGDLFTSVVLGGLLRGERLFPAADRAADFTARAVRRTLDLGTPPPYGVSFEPLLGLLTPAPPDPS